jgi:hypothetical protein
MGGYLVLSTGCIIAIHMSGQLIQVSVGYLRLSRRCAPSNPRVRHGK